MRHIAMPRPSRSLLGGVMMAGMLASGAATATAASASGTPAPASNTAATQVPTFNTTPATEYQPTWPSCDGDGIANNCPPLGGAAAASSAQPTWPSCDGDGIPNNCPPLGGGGTAAPASASTGGSSTSGSASASDSAIVNAARQAVGTSYAYGGSSLSGMDCSGLVTWVYDRAGIDLNGRTADQIMRGGQSISLSAAQPGDLVGYKSGSGFSHVGIYLGNNQIIDASGSKSVVTERGMWNADWQAVTYR